MGSLPIVLLQPWVQVHLQLLQTPVEILPEEQAVAFVLQGLVEPFADAVGLGMVGLGPGMVNVLHRQVELVGVVLQLSTILGAPCPGSSIIADLHCFIINATQCK